MKEDKDTTNDAKVANIVLAFNNGDCAMPLSLNIGDDTDTDAISIEDNKITFLANHKFDVMTIAPNADARLNMSKLKFVGLPIVDDSPNIDLKKEWRAPFFGSKEYKTSSYGPMTKAQADEQGGYVELNDDGTIKKYTVSTVSLFLNTDKDSQNMHEFSIIYYNPGTGNIGVFDPGVRNEES